uniref:Uncharacterized protein n=1 Tax=Caenorhabditis tropicalis TaxID=1561998 RepID=A0A1I7V3F5_9PELO
MRKQAEIRSLQIFRRVQLQQKYTTIKERNANFAVDLRKMMDEHGVEEHRKTYEEAKKETKRLFEERFAVDETVNLNFHRWSSSQEEFTKASNDLQNKKGVIGTLGSRKIRAKQQMQWRDTCIIFCS